MLRVMSNYLLKKANERLSVLNTILYRNIITQNIPVRDEELSDGEGD